MSIRALFTRSFALTAIDGIREYHDAMEKELQSLSERKRDEVLLQVESLNLPSEEAWMERDLALQEHRGTFNMLFANYLRYSCIALLFLTLEYQIHEICQATRLYKSIKSSIKRPQREILNYYKDYLEKEIGVVVDWSKIFDLNKIRNCIIHASGNIHAVEKSRHKKGDYLIFLAQRMKGLSISGINYDYNSETDPLYLEDGMLVLEPEFCTNAILEAHRFVDEICQATNLPLPFTQNQ